MASVALKKALILVEGQTEESFVREVLASHFEPRGCHFIPTVVKTKRLGATTFAGGVSSYTKIKGDLLRLLGDSSAVLVTTMFDFYGLPKDFPGKSKMPAGSCYSQVEFLEEAITAEIARPNFIPYLALHEFEAMLFSSVPHILQEFPNAKVQGQLDAIRKKFSSPEEINHENPPSYRIIKLIPEYDKLLHGTLISLSIGIDVIRTQCSHFNAWVTLLEDRLGAR